MSRVFPVHQKQLLPVLVVWAPPRKKRNQEQHALNGNTSPSTAGSPPRSARQGVHLANDDDLEATWTSPGVMKLAWNVSSCEAGVGRHPYPPVDILEMVIVAATEAHRRHILTMVLHWHNRPVITFAAETVGLHAGREGQHPPGF